MKNTTLDFSNLLSACNSLEASLFYWRYHDYDAWDDYELEDEDIKTFVRDLYSLAHECICMHLRINAPEMPGYVFNEGEGLSKPDFIVLTRQLIFCCDSHLIHEYRDLTRNEYESIRYLEIMHARFIGDYYFQHPGMEILSGDEFRRHRED